MNYVKSILSRIRGHRHSGDRVLLVVFSWGQRHWKFQSHWNGCACRRVSGESPLASILDHCRIVVLAVLRGQSQQNYFESVFLLDSDARSFDTGVRVCRAADFSFDALPKSVKPMAKEKAEYTNIIQLLKRLTRCESCRYVFQKKDRCFEKKDSEHPQNP